MLIVDSQVHTWTAGTPPVVHQQAPFTNADLLREMDAARVDRVVLVPPGGWDPASSAHADEGVRLHPDRFAIMSGLALDRPERRNLLPAWKRAGRLGLRLTFASPDRIQGLRDGAFDWLWEGAQTANIPIMFAIWGNLAAALPIVQRYPGIRFIIDHLGIAVTHRTMDDAAFADMPAVLALAKFPHVAIKASGLTAHSTQPYPYRNIHRYIRQAYDAFGPQRMFWGTDLTRARCAYRQCITLFTEELPWLSASDKELIMGRALCDWIDWKLPV